MQSKVPPHERRQGISDIVQALIARRLELNLSGEETARRAGISSNVIKLGENGWSPPSLKNLIAWAGALGCTVELCLDPEFKFVPPQRLGRSLARLGHRPVPTPKSELVKASSVPVPIPASTPPKPVSVPPTVVKQKPGPKPRVDQRGPKWFQKRSKVVGSDHREDQEAIQKYLKEKGATKAPSMGTPEFIRLNEEHPLMWDRKKLRLTRAEITPSTGSPFRDAVGSSFDRVKANRGNRMGGRQATIKKESEIDIDSEAETDVDG